MRFLSSVLALLISLPVFGQSITFADLEIKGAKGAWIIVAPTKIDGGTPKWRVDSGLQEVQLGALLPMEFVTKLKGRVFSSNMDGKYKVELWNAKGDVASDIVTVWVIVGDPKPPPPPPDPKPDPVPVPIPGTGFRAMIIYDPAARPAEMPDPQRAIIYSKMIRDYLDSKGKDGTSPRYRIWQTDADASKEAQAWQTMYARPRSKVPWIIIATDQQIFEGPLPANVADTLTLLKKYGG